MATSEELDLTFKKVGNDFGFGNVTTEYAPFRNLKVRLQRTYEWANFEIADYLEEAPAEIIEGLARTILSRICGEDAKYSEETIKWLASHGFRATNQNTYIKRSRLSPFRWTAITNFRKTTRG